MSQCNKKYPTAVRYSNPFVGTITPLPSLARPILSSCPYGITGRTTDTGTRPQFATYHTGSAVLLPMLVLSVSSFDLATTSCQLVLAARFCSRA